jgi:hypothetical protein
MAERKSKPNSTEFNVFLRSVKMWWENTPFFGPNFANQSHTYKMMWKPRKFDVFHTSNIESFGTRFKRSNTPEYISLKPNKVYRANISRTSLPWLKESQSLYFETTQCVLKVVKMWWENTPSFGPNFANQSHGYKMMWNRANSMHFTHPILNRLERSSNVRILLNTYRLNQTRFIERISVELYNYC